MLTPVFAADVSPSNPKATYEGRCFEEITFEYEKVNETSFNVHVTTANPKQTVCNDTILFANTEIQHFEVFYFHGTHKLTFEMTTPEAQADVGFGGIKAYAFCDSVKESLESLITTLKLFVQFKTRYDHPAPAYMEKASVDFLKGAMGVELEVRETQKVEIDVDSVQSGDFLGAMRTDGLGTIIQYGTGAHISHNVMALRLDDGLYIVESTDPGGLRAV